MDYYEAKRLAEAWTTGQDVSQDGWRSVIRVLMDHIYAMEADLKSAYGNCQRLRSENESLSLDLGIKNNDFKLPPQKQLQTVADIIKECSDKASW
jgi:hypothetical protein